MSTSSTTSAPILGQWNSSTNNVAARLIDTNDPVNVRMQDPSYEVDTALLARDSYVHNVIEAAPGVAVATPGAAPLWNASWSRTTKRDNGFVGIGTQFDTERAA
ncbi:hypothetical protein G7Z17_g2553 [Cylindrodendrum hubeiense]|uniref:Uncharacterized protein n=1 Tax=Cylindrodendrum hubeiense TaxID=595255 RepID=A0A9P5LKW9_9HYPO|nr:hypothetical protein G7Z17_g2553 [Cylindrodendrum hubeiense]